MGQRQPVPAPRVARAGRLCRRLRWRGVSRGGREAVPGKKQFGLANTCSSDRCRAAASRRPSRRQRPSGQRPGAQTSRCGVFRAAGRAAVPLSWGCSAQSGWAPWRKGGVCGGEGKPSARLVGSAPRLPALCCPLSVAGPGLGAAGWTAWLALGGDVGARVRGSGSQTCAFGPALAPPGLRRCHWGGSSLLGPESPSPSAGETLLAPAVCGHLFPQLRGRLVLETPCVCVSVRAAGLQGQAAGCGLWNRRANLAGVLRASSGPRRKTVARLSQCRSDSTQGALRLHVSSLAAGRAGGEAGDLQVLWLLSP